MQTQLFGSVSRLSAQLQPVVPLLRAGAHHALPQPLRQSHQRRAVLREVRSRGGSIHRISVGYQRHVLRLWAGLQVHWPTVSGAAGKL